MKPPLRGRLVLITPPTTEPVAPDEVEQHLRLTTNDDAAVRDVYVRAAREHFDGRDGILGRALVTQTWEYVLDRFPYGVEPIQIPLPPLQSVTSVKYIDGAGVEQTWPSSDYQVDLTDNRLRPAYGKSYPSPRDVMNAVTIRFVAGYGAPGAVPDPIRTAILQYAAHLYEHREPVVVGAVAVPVPMHLEALISPYTVWSLP